MLGEKLTPVTRKEMFLAKASGQDVQTPEPITREEMFLNKISGGSLGNAVSATIIENGTYSKETISTEVKKNVPIKFREKIEQDDVVSYCQKYGVVFDDGRGYMGTPFGFEDEETGDACLGSIQGYTFMIQIAKNGNLVAMFAYIPEWTPDHALPEGWASLDGFGWYYVSITADGEETLEKVPAPIIVIPEAATIVCEDPKEIEFLFDTKQIDAFGEIVVRTTSGAIE